MRRWVGPTAALLFFLVLAPSHAADVGVGVRAGTQGLGAELGFGVTGWLGIRGGFYTGSLSFDYEETGIEYDGDLDVGGLGVVADFHPFRNGFRVSAGLFSNDNGIGIKATPTEPQEIGGTIYDPAEIGTLNGDVGFDSTAPYLGLGWGRLAGGKRLAFLFDLGVLRQGSGDVSLSSSTGLIDPADLEAEIAEIESDIEDYDLWPVVSFGLAIRF
jgi:hypothetical protein